MNKILKIYDGIYLIGGPGISGDGDCLIYLISSNDELILIDSGVDENSVDNIIKNIKKLNLNPNNLKYLILTHCHIDHIGGASALQRKFDIKVVAHEIESPIIEGRKNPERTAAFFYGVEYEPCKVDIKLKGELNMIEWKGDTIKILFTPGHTPGGISPYIDINDKRVLFGQDIHGPLMKSFGSNLKDYLKSMNKLLKLEADILCEGHFGVFEPREKVIKYIQGYIEQYSRKL
ncbi:MAG: MBL fold metallo-hydrolase [Candidatus Helarchaeota archaeon]